MPGCDRPLGPVTPDSGTISTSPNPNPMKPRAVSRFSLSRVSSLAFAWGGLIFLNQAATALDVVHTLPGGSTASWSTAGWSNGVPDAIGDVAQHTTAGAVPVTSINISPTIGSLKQTGGTSWTLTASGSNSVTFDGTGMSASNNGFTNGGVASIVNASGGSLLVLRSNIILATSLDVGMPSGSGTGTITIGDATANTHSIVSSSVGTVNLNFRHNIATAGSITVNSSIGATGSSIAISNLSTSGTGNLTLNGNLGPAVTSITQSSTTSRMVLSGTNTNTGTITVTAGTLAATNRVSLFNGVSSDWTASKIAVGSGATLALGYGSAGSFTASEISTIRDTVLTAGSRLGIENSATATYSTVIADAASGTASIGFVKSGAGALTISGANTYSGGTTISAGTLILGSAQGATSGPLGLSSGGMPVGDIFFNGGALQLSATNSTDYSSRFSTAANNAVNINTAGQNITFGTALTSSGGSLTKAGAGTLTLNRVNTYTGTTNVTGGTLLVTDSAAYTDPGTTTLSKFFGTGTMQIGNATLQIRVNGSNDATTQTLSYGNQLQVATTGASYNINIDRESATGGTNKIIAFGNHNVGSNTTMNLTGANDYSLSVNILQLGGGTTPSIMTLNPTSANLIVGSVSNGTNTVNPTLRLDGLTSGNTITGTIANNSTGVTSIQKTNSSTWTLNGANSYTGTTSVSGGTLLMNGSISGAAGAVTVTAAGTLGGAGTFNTPVTVSGFIAPGSTTAGAGILRVNSSTAINGLDLGSGGTYLWDLKSLADNTTGTAGTHFDQITLSGLANLVLGGTSKLTLNLSDVAGPDSADPFWLSSRQWTIVDADATTTNTGSTNFSEITNGSYAAGTFSTAADSLGNVILTFTPVPEPSALLMIVGSGGLLMVRRRNG